MATKTKVLDLTAKIKAAKFKASTYDVDVSEMLGEKPGTVVWTFKTLSIADAHRAAEDVRLIKKIYPKIPESLAQVVSGVAAAFTDTTAEIEMTPRELFGQIALEMPELWAHLISNIDEEVSKMFRMNGRVEEEKKDS